MRRLPLAAVTVLTAAVLLTGCSLPGAGGSGSSASRSAAPKVAPATGPELTGSGYTLHVPEGWAVTATPTAPIDGQALGPIAVDDFTDNLNIMKSPGGHLSAEQVEKAGPAELKSVGATDVTVLPRVTVAGSESAHLTAKLTSQGVTYLTDQYMVSTDAQTYVVTFSFHQSASTADRSAVTGSVLASWSWN